MRYSIPVFIALMIALMFSCSSEKTGTEPRTTENFGTGWEFTRDTSAAVWEKVNLPHTARIEPLVVNDQWQGTAFYKKSFELPASKDKKVFLYFEGVMHKADVWINGKHLCHHEGGYLPFTVDASEALFTGKPNEIKVRINNQDNPDIPPGKPLKELDFNYYGGIYRNVYLITTSETYITDAVAAGKTNSGGVLVRFDNVIDQKADGSLKIHIKNETDTEKKVHFVAVFSDKEGQKQTVTSDPGTIKPGSDLELVQNFDIENPKLWSPQHPNLYTVEISLFANEKLVDKISETTGIRSLEMKEGVFYINGDRQYIRGTNRHQEYPYVGYALSDEAQYRDAVKIKNAGFDFVRLSHYPHAEAFMDACDELGLLVMNCIPGWQFVGGEKFIGNSLQDCRDMIRRDRNHPSVIFWEVSLNESQMPEDYILKATQIVREELPFEGIYTAGWVDHPAYDLFIPARQHGQPPDYWNFYKDGKRSVFIAEYGDWEYYAQNAGFNQTAFSNLKEDERTSRQLREWGEKRLLQQAFNFQEAANSNRTGTGTIGDANWLMFDYNRGYTDDLEASGISDIFRIPKFAYYFYQSQRPPDEILDSTLVSGPMVKIASYWNKQSATDVRIFSNCSEVELYLNGTLVSKQNPTTDKYSDYLPFPPFVFGVGKFAPGELKAIGFLDGKAVAEDVVKTPGQPVALKVEVDLSGIPVSKDFPDVLIVHASVMDAEGTVCLDASGWVKFSVNGQAVLLGENPAPVKAGLASVLLRSEHFHQPIEIGAVADGLKEGSFVISPMK